MLQRQGLNVLSGARQVVDADVTGHGGLLQQRDELVKEHGDDVPEGLGQDDAQHRDPVGQPQGAGRLHLAGVDGLDPPAEDLRDVGPGIEAEGQDGDMKRVDVPYRREYGEVPDQELHHDRGPAHHGDVEVGQGVQQADPGPSPMRHPDHADQQAQEKADHGREGGHDQRGLQTVDQHPVAPVQDEILVKLLSKPYPGGRGEKTAARQQNDEKRPADEEAGVATSGPAPSAGRSVPIRFRGGGGRHRYAPSSPRVRPPVISRPAPRSRPPGPRPPVSLPRHSCRRSPCSSCGPRSR